MQQLTREYEKDWSEDSEWIFNTPCEFTKRTLFYIQEAGWFRELGEKYYTKQKNIASYLIMLTTKGAGEYCYRGTTHLLREGDLIYVNSMEEHSHGTCSGSGEKWDVIWVQFNGPTALGYYELFSSAGRPVVNVAGNEKVSGLLRRLVKLCRTKNLGSDLDISRTLVELLTELLFEAGAAISSQGNMPDYIQSAIKDIDAHFCERLDLKYFSETLAVSKYHFLREFKKYTGTTPNEYIINTRINYAKSLLTNTNLTVSAIAEKVGFSSASHFISMFKARTTQTPMQFQKTNG